MDTDLVPLLVNVPRELRMRVKVRAVTLDTTIASFVIAALEDYLISHRESGS